MNGAFVGRAVVVTGASSGTGRELARLLRAQGARVLVVGRDRNRTMAVAGELGAPMFLVDNLDLDTVADLAARILEQVDHIDYLFSNAGAALTDQSLTRNGNEPNYQVNALAPLLLERLLTPALVSTPRGRIVATSSRSHRGATLTPGSVAIELQDTEPGAHQRYVRAKLATLIAHAEERTLPGTIPTVDIHPGIIATDFGRYMGRVGTVLKTLATPFLSSPRIASHTLASIAAERDTAHPYYHRRTPRSPSPLVNEQKIRDEVTTDIDQRLAPWISVS